jgi:hypothetical protein
VELRQVFYSTWSENPCYSASPNHVLALLRLVQWQGSTRSMPLKWIRKFKLLEQRRYALVYESCKIEHTTCSSKAEWFIHSSANKHVAQTMNLKMKYWLYNLLARFTNHPKLTFVQR